MAQAADSPGIIYFAGGRGGQYYYLGGGSDGAEKNDYDHRIGDGRTFAGFDFGAFVVVAGGRFVQFYP